jgi:acetylglutamate kinase
MIPKIDCSIDSIKSGTKNVHIIGGGKKHSILEEIFTNDGIGTMIGG